MLGVAAALVAARPALAAEPRSDTLDFLATLRERGYADFASEYLQAHENDPRLPKDVHELWDLEMANNLWACAARTNDAAESQLMRTAAEQHLAKFLKDKPNHPAVAGAMVTWGDSFLERGLTLYESSKAVAEGAEREKILVTAREAFDEAHSRFGKAVDAYQAQIKALTEDAADGADHHRRPPRGGGDSPTPLELVRFHWAEARCNAALADYWSAQTISDTKNPQRLEMMRTAGKSFGQIYQDFRADEAGLFAHYWNAKIVGESGDPATALDICDEILSIAPEPKAVTRSYAESQNFKLLTEAYVLQLQMWVQSGQEKKASDEATLWLTRYINIQASSSYQGVALELVKIEMGMLEKAVGERRNTLRHTMLDQLAKIIAVRGRYQQEAVALRRQVVGGHAKGDDKTFEGLVALGDAAAQGQEWDKALAMYSKALELLPKEPALTDAQRKELLTHVRDQMAHVHYLIATGMLAEKKFADIADASEKIARDFSDTPFGAKAAILAMYAVHQLSANSKLSEAERGALYDRLSTIGEMTIKTWPSLPEADDACLALGQVEASRGNPEKAIENFRRVRPGSPRLPTALLSAAKQAWRIYLAEKEKPERERNAERLEKSRASAQKWLASSLEAQSKVVGPAPPPGSEDPQKQLRDQLVDSQLLLADVYLENREEKKSLAIYTPLIESALKNPTRFDSNMLRTFGGAIKVYVAQGNLTKASELGVSLARLGGDQPPVNRLLVGLSSYLVKDLQQAEANEILVSQGNDLEKLHKAQAQLLEARDRLSQVLAQLAPREQVPLRDLLYVGDNCSRAGLKKESRIIYERILARAQKDSNFEQANPGVIVRTRGQLVGLLRDEGKFDEAVRQINELLKSYPGAMNLLLQKGRILQAWGKIDPSHYKDAVIQWSILRQMMARMQPRPPEYYEVIYSAAECLFFESQQGKNPASASEAEQLLRATLVLSPALSGPDMVARYNVLISKSVALQKAKTSE